MSNCDRGWALPGYPHPPLTAACLHACLPDCLPACCTPTPPPSPPCPPPPALPPRLPPQVNETLNACPLDAASCVSTLNDDEAHFSAPWEFDGSRDDAVAALIAVVTGGQYEAGLIDSFGGIKQTDAAAYIAKGVFAVATGGWVGGRAGRQQCRHRSQRSAHVHPSPLSPPNPSPPRPTCGCRGRHAGPAQAAAQGPC